jgi:type VI secretion system ImpM family protein
MDLRGTGFFGKVPAAGDFQRMLLPEGPDARLLEWWNDGWTRHALAGRRPDLQQPVHWVVQKPGTTVALLGTMVASRDRSGRRFPLLVFGAVHGATGAAGVVAGSAEFLARAEGVAATGRSGIDVPGLRAHVESLRSAYDPEGAERQRAWQATTRAAAWADGAPNGLAGRLRMLDFAFSGGGRPNFAVRGRWQGDVRHLAAGLDLLQRLAKAPPAMVFWSCTEAWVDWRVAFDYASSSQFEALVWSEAEVPTAFDTEPSTVTIPPAFVGRAAPADDASVATMLESR